MALQEKKSGISESSLLNRPRGFTKRRLHTMIPKDFQPLQLIDAGPPDDGERRQVLCSRAICTTHTSPVSSSKAVFLAWNVVNLRNELSSLTRWRGAADGSMI